jgi:hypothetical protein
MHEMVVEALLIATFYLGDELILIHIRKSFPVECLSRANSWSLSS